MKHGAPALSQQEIIAVIIGRGGAGKPVLELANELIVRFKGLSGLAVASIEELKDVSGIGPAKATQLKAACELARRLLMTGDEKCGRAISKAQDVYDLILPETRGKKVEHFYLLMLDSRSRLIRTAEISKGSLSSTVVHPREVFKEAIAASAAAVIFVHNHPSGDPEPSDDDIALTRRLVSAGQVLGIPVHDHVIVTDTGMASLKSRNII